MASFNDPSPFVAPGLRMGQVQQRNRGRRAPKCSPDSVRLDHRIQYIERQQQLGDSCKFPFYSTCSGNADASANPFSTLQKVTIRDLRLEEVAKGKYLILRTIELPFKIVGIMTVVEDDAGNVSTFAVYNFCSDFDADPEEILPVGTIFILKEPYLKVPTVAPNDPCILRCDCPTDIIILNENHSLFCLVKDIQWKNDLGAVCKDPILSLPRPKLSTEWKCRGNDLFNSGKISCAINCYLLALRETEKMQDCDELYKTLHLNLAICHLKLQCFESALASATKVLDMDPKNLKALFRAGKAMYELRKFKEAANYFKNLHETYPENEAGKDEWTRTKDRISEQESGNVSMYRLSLERASRPGQNIDCADFVGPIKVVKIPGKQRGVIATEDIDPGTLLVVSKAFKAVWIKPGEVCMQFNLNKTLDHGDNVKLVSAVAQAIMKNPHTFGPLVYDLSLGKYEAECRSSLKVFCDPVTKTEPIANVPCIKHILNTNCFTVGSREDYLTRSTRTLKGIDTVSGSGLFLFPSYFNYSCLPNARWTVYNDVMIIRSVQLIKHGEEISISYFSPVTEHQEKKKNLEQRGFRCSCRCCTFLQKEPAKVRLERERLMTHFTTHLKPQFLKEHAIVTHGIVSSLEKLVSSMEATYTPAAESNFCKLEMVVLYRYLHKSYLRQRRFDEAVASCWKAISSFGFDPSVLIRIVNEPKNWSFLSKGFLNDELMNEIIYLILVYWNGDRLRDVIKWARVIIVLDGILTGGDDKCVKLNYPQIAALL